MASVPQVISTSSTKDFYDHIHTTFNPKDLTAAAKQDATIHEGESQPEFVSKIMELRTIPLQPPWLKGEWGKEKKVKDQKRDLPEEKVIRGPLDYMLSLPGKQMRSELILAFNEWFKVPGDKLKIITGVIELLHTASLLIDDIQDGSKLRREHPVAHTIFGTAQTINSANYAYFLALQALEQLKDGRVCQIFTEELLNLHRGQGMELYWRESFICPTEEEYLRMVSNKTGGLFRLASKLLQTQSEVSVDCASLVENLGQIYQIRDDYLNLQSGLYARKKGFGEDLTEGKFSFPIIHSILSAPHNTPLTNILRQRTEDEAIKAYAIRYIESTQSFQHCRDTLNSLCGETASMVDQLEVSVGRCQRIRGIINILQTEHPETKAASPPS